MKRSHTHLAAAILAIAAAPVFAHDWDGNPDMAQSILNDHSSGFVGTGFSPAKLERGSGDTYGWIVLDVQAGESHVPHKSADGHGPEKGFGDTYGSVLNDL